MKTTRCGQSGLTTLRESTHSRHGVPFPSACSGSDASALAWRGRVSSSSSPVHRLGVFEAIVLLPRAPKSYQRRGLTFYFGGAGAGCKRCSLSVGRVIGSSVV